MGRKFTSMNYWYMGILILIAVAILLLAPKGYFDRLTGFQVYETLAVPNQPVLSSPINSSQHSFAVGITFTWTGSDPDGDSISYLFQISNHSAFQNGNITHNFTLVNPNYTLPINNLSTGIGKYYWRVRSNDSTGDSAFSEIWELKVVNAVINISSPINSTVLNSGSSIVIQVNEIENGGIIDTMNLYIDYNGTNNTYTALNTSNTTVTNYTYTYTLPNNITYIDVIAYGYNSSQLFNSTSNAEYKLTVPYAQAGGVNMTMLCPFPSYAEHNTSLNITVKFVTGTLVDTVNLTLIYPNGSQRRLNENGSNFQKKNIF